MDGEEVGDSEQMVMAVGTSVWRRMEVGFCVCSFF